MQTREQIAIMVLDIVDDFIIDNEIACADEIYHSNKVIRNAYKFIEDLCDVAGYLE